MSKKKQQTTLHRNGKIELLRFVFAFFVAFFHLGCSVEHSSEKFKTGYMAVEFFFLVTGYLMAKSLSKELTDNSSQGNERLINTSLSFAWKKYTSFIYTFLVSVVFTSAAWINYYDLSAKEWILKMADAVPTFLLLPVFGFKTAPWYIPTWYLSAMMVTVVILTPILLKHGKFYSLYAAPVLSLAMLGFIYRSKGYFDVNGDNWEGRINLGLLRAFAEISLGCTAYYLVEGGYLKKFGRKLLSAAAILCYAAVFAFMFGDYDHSMQIIVILLMFAAVLVTFNNGDTFKFLNNKFVYFLGKLSLPVYLFHTIARNYILKINSINDSYLKQCVVLFIATIALSLVGMALAELLKKLVEKVQKF